MAYLTQAQIMAAHDIRYTEVSVPEWGGLVRIKSLTDREKSRVEQQVLKSRGKSRDLNVLLYKVGLLAASMVNEKGSKLFEEKDIEKLRDKSAQAVDRVFLKIQDLNGMTEKDIEDMVENSDATPLDDSDSL